MFASRNSYFIKIKHMYELNDYGYVLPEGLIAQQPAERRDRSRLLRLDRMSGRVTHGTFGDIADLLAPGDVLVRNNTRVIPGRLLGRKPTGGRVEVLVLDFAQGVTRGEFTCLVKASKRPRPGSRLIFDQGLEARVLDVQERTCTLAFEGVPDFEAVLERIGHVPLPPYIRRADTNGDHDTYQTVYAAEKGAIAAPTAGLHFTPSLLERLADRGVVIADLTLHVGYGTFLPVEARDIRDHRMHSEWFTLPGETAEAVNQARAAGRRVVAVGTTCVRTLEYCAGPGGRLEPLSGACDLFIYPGYEFRAVDAMITNFHLPKSTLLMLVSAFAGRERILAAYAEAVRLGYRFFSYGDAMIIL
ncbi:tRNA preQ1(34) S-adenosylmethionine ribosyltransferase-isomerase QueA [Desulfatitalea tepidiphila]|uniref:tRNA preQ1(34) S-adenosylmethionine ribosyltransferase-isomerase QueA n=1 Tax=Desulfatitalea tepidiphila TaxID=1185843 RepID=UPI00350E4F99